MNLLKKKERKGRKKVELTFQRDYSICSSMHLICSTDMKCMVCATVCSHLVKKTILQTKNRKVVLGFLPLLTYEFAGMLMLFVV